MNIEQTISAFLEWLGKSCYDDLPPQCFADSTFCTCQSFQVAAWLGIILAVALGILFLLRFVDLQKRKVQRVE